MRVKQLVACCITLAMLILSLIVVVAQPVKAEWIPYATLTKSEGKLYPQEQITVQYTLDIYTIPGVASVQITSVLVEFDWESSPVQVSPGTVVFVLPDSHTYSRTITIPQSVSLGQHSATVKVTGQAVGDWWATDNTWTFTYVAETRPPLELAVSGNPSTGTYPLTVDFYSSTTGGTPPYAYSWTFGDGGSSIAANPSHTYVSAGAFTATLTVNDALSRMASDTFQIIVVAPPSVSIDANVVSGVSPLNVDFTSSVSGGTPPYSYSWTFEDGSTSSQANPSHSFTSVGTFSVTLSVTDSSSSVVTSNSIQITVTAPPDDNAQEGGTGSILGDNAWLIVVVIIAAVILLAAIIVVMARRKK